MKNFFKFYLRYLKVVRKTKWKYIGSWIFLAILLSLNNVSIFVVGYLIDQVNQDDNRLIYLLGAIAATLALPLIVEPIAFHLKTRVFSKAVNSITSQVYNNVLNLDYNFHINKQTGKLISIIIGTPEIVHMYIWQVEWFFLENIAALIIPIILIAIISPQIALATSLIIIFLAPSLLWILKINFRRRKALKDADYDRNSAIIDGLSNFETLRSFGTELREVTQLQEKLNICENAMNKYQNSFRAIDFVSRAMGIIVFITGSILSVRLYQRGELSLGYLVVIITYLIQMTGMLTKSVFTLRDTLKNLPIAEDFYALVDADREIKEIENPHYLNNPEGRIRFKEVNFRYEKSQTVLNNLTIDIEPNQSIALVGPSGGGKSTITRLLLRYYDVSSGSITIDGVNVKNLALDNLREIIGLVPQEPVLFNRSILYNVGYALENLDETPADIKEIVIEACKKAHVHDFIESLPQGYETIVGERGLKLSGGQKQRLAIARLLIKNPKIVIFDEATSMLDSESERAIQKAFRELSRDKTTIIIAHRLSTITHCDKIFVIDQGRVVEEGTHNSLIKGKGIYSNLWEIQSGGFIRGNGN